MLVHFRMSCGITSNTPQLRTVCETSATELVKMCFVVCDGKDPVPLTVHSKLTEESGTGQNVALGHPAVSHLSWTF